MEKISKSDFVVLSLRDVLDTIGESGYKKLISDFYCPKDHDLEYFLKNKAIALEEADFQQSRTYLVGFQGSEKFCLCGYFALTNKPFVLSDDISNSKRKSITSGRTDQKAISAVLIGQLGKNYDNGLNYTIDGKDLLSCAIEMISIVYKSIGVELIYLECKDNDKLKKFYKDCGFDLYVDKRGEPILTGKNGKLLCFLAKYKNIKIIK